MRKKRHLSKRREKYRYSIVVLFLVFCLAMSIGCFRYYQSVQDTVTNESSGYLQEISKQIGENVSRAMNDNFSIVETAASVLRHADADTFEALAPLIRDQQEIWNFQNLLLIDESGNAYDAQGNKQLLGSEKYLRQAIVERKRSMSAAQVVNGSECVLFAAPVEGITVNNIPISAIAASYELSTFGEILSMSAFDGKGYCSINQRDGSVVVHSSSEYAMQGGYNTLSTLAAAEMDPGSSLEQVRSDLNAGKSGMAGLTFRGVHLYMTYTPLNTGEWCLFTFVPVQVVNSKSQALLHFTLLLCSAITLAFAVIFIIFLISSYRHKRKLEQIAYVDPVTGGNTIQRFYELAGALLNAPDKPEYALVYVNIEKFKILNEQFGRAVGDEVLSSVCRAISEDLSERECMGRLSADNFCVLAQYEGQQRLLERMDCWYETAVEDHRKSGKVWLEPILEFGIFLIHDEAMLFPQMTDRAKLALRASAHDFRDHVRCAVYDDSVRRRLVREKELEDRMGPALQNEEFLIYLQPKYCVSSEKIGGAEALVRWQSVSEGMIYPDEFISLFEKNGFIIQLDLFVFEQTCKTIRSWMDRGIPPIKISVNCSRIHLKVPGFLEKYRQISDRYDIPRQYLEIELTENVVFEDVANLSGIIDEIHQCGFGCSMDDFGSGYSSLNMIQDIPVDTIKLDKIFFRSTSKEPGRTESVVGSILTMSKSLHMETVAEGVETREHVEMLKRLGCDYIQGYYFAKPMPIPAFEELAFGICPEQEEDDKK